MSTPEIALTADVVLLTVQNNEWHVLLIQRGHPPYQGQWALPGGYVEADEDFDTAARRELAEETGILAPDHLGRLGIYGAPGRDPRGRVVTVAYVALLTDMPDPTAGDDAAAARWVPVAPLLAQPALVAFDHATILADAIASLSEVILTRPVADIRGTWEFSDSVGDRLTVTAQPDLGRVTVHIHESTTSIAEAFVWFLPETACDMAAALVSAADMVDSAA